MKEKLNTYAGQLYLDINVSQKYPEQCPEYRMAKWWDLLWMLIPICGFLIFCSSIKYRHIKTKEEK